MLPAALVLGAAVSVLLADEVPEAEVEEAVIPVSRGPGEHMGYWYNLHSLVEAEAEAEAELPEAEAEAEAEAEEALVPEAVDSAVVVLAAAVDDEDVTTVVTLMPADVVSSLSPT